MSTFTDITKTGAQSYRDLQKQNNGSNLSSQEAALLKAFSGWATATPSKYDVSNLRSREIEDPIYQATGGKDHWGNSIWDDDVANVDTLDHLQNRRANNQSGIVQILNGAGKAVTTAVTTALDGTLGTLYGLGTGITNVVTGAKNADGSDKGFIQGLWDNDFNRAMAAAQEEAEDLMPNYYTDYEQNAPWYNNIFSANFLGDKVIKNAGFTIGALAATTLTGGVGGTAGKTVQALAKGIAKQALKGGSVSAAKTALKAGREFGQIANYAVNTALSAHGEAAVEAINGINDAFKTLDANVAARRQELLSNLNPQDPNYDAKVQQINKAVQEYKDEQSGLLTQAGNNIYLANLALLSATNSLEFGDLIKGGFGQTAKLAKRTYTVEGKEATLEQWGKALIEGRKADVVNGVNDGIGKVALHTAKNFASEGFEEGAQNIASNTNQYYAMAELNRRVEDKKSPLHALSLSRAEINPEASSKLANYGEAFSKTIQEQFGSIDAPGWEEVFLGGLTGALGFYNPMHKEVTKDKNGDVVRDNYGNVIQKWKPLSLGAIEGGFLGAHREVTEAKEENEKLVKLINDATSKPEFIRRVRHAVASLDFEQAMSEALANDDKLSFKNAEVGKIISDALYFRDKGAIDEYKAIFEGLTNLDDRTLGQIYLAANSEELEKEEVEKVRQEYQDKAKSTLAKINDTLKYYDYVEEAHRTMPEAWKREMANYYIRWSNTRDRIKQLEDKYTKDALKEIHDIPEEDIMNDLNTLHSSSFTNDRDRDDYFRLKKQENLLNKTIKEYEKDPKKLWQEITGAVLQEAAKKLSLDSNALIDKLKTATSPQDVDEILQIADESIRESVFREAFRNADSKTRGYIYQQMLMANASQVLFDSLKQMGLSENSDTYKGLSQFMAYIFQQGKLNTKDTKDAIKQAFSMVVSPDIMQDEINEMLDHFNDEGKRSLQQYLDLIKNNGAERSLLEDFLDSANRVLDEVASRYGAWEATEASRTAPSTPPTTGGSTDTKGSTTTGTTTSTEGDTTYPAGSYAAAIHDRQERVKDRCTGPLALKYPTIAAIIADSNPGMDSAAIEKRLKGFEAELGSSAKAFGIDTAGVDEIVSTIEEAYFTNGYDRGLGVPGSDHVEAGNLLDSAFINNDIKDFLNQQASKKTKEQFVDMLKKIPAPLTSEMGIKNAAILSYIETGHAEVAIPTTTDTKGTEGDDIDTDDGTDGGDSDGDISEARKVYNSLDSAIQQVFNTYAKMENPAFTDKDIDTFETSRIEELVQDIVYAQKLLDSDPNTDFTKYEINQSIAAAVKASRTPAGTEEVRDSTPNMQLMYGSEGTMLGMVMTPYSTAILDPSNVTYGHSALTLQARANNYNLTEGMDNAIKIQRIIDNHLRKLQYLSDKKTLRPVHFISAKHMDNAVLSSIEYTADVEKEVPASEAWIVQGQDGKNYMIIGVSGYANATDLSNTKETWEKLKEAIKAEHVGDETYHVYTKETGSISNISDGRTIDEYAPNGTSMHLTLAQMLQDSATNPLGLTPGDLKFQIMYPDGPRGVNISNERIYSLSKGSIGTVYMLIPMANGIYYRVPMKPIFLKDVMTTGGSLHSECDKILDQIANDERLADSALQLKGLFHFVDDELFIGEQTINGEKCITIRYKGRTGVEQRKVIPIGDKQALYDSLAEINPPVNTSLVTLGNTSFVKKLIEAGWSPESVQMLAGAGAGFAVSMTSTVVKPIRKDSQGSSSKDRTIITLKNNRYKKEKGKWTVDDTGDEVTNSTDIETLDLAEAIEAGKYEDQAEEWYIEDGGKQTPLPGVYYTIGTTMTVEGEPITTNTIIHRDEKGNYTRHAPFEFRQKKYKGLMVRPLISSNTNDAVQTLLDKITKAKDEYCESLSIVALDTDKAKENRATQLATLEAERDSLQNLSTADKQAIDDALEDLNNYTLGYYNWFYDHVTNNAIFNVSTDGIGISTGFQYQGKDLKCFRELTQEEKQNLKNYIENVGIDSMAWDTLEKALPDIIAGKLNNHNSSMSEEDAIKIFSTFATKLTQDYEGTAYDQLIDKLQELIAEVDLDDLTIGELSKEAVKLIKSKGPLQALVTLQDESKDLSEQLKSLLEIIENCK